MAHYNLQEVEGKERGGDTQHKHEILRGDLERQKGYEGVIKGA